MTIDNTEQVIHLQSKYKSNCFIFIAVITRRIKNTHRGAFSISQPSHAVQRLITFRVAREENRARVIKTIAANVIIVQVQGHTDKEKKLRINIPDEDKMCWFVVAFETHSAKDSTVISAQASRQYYFHCHPHVIRQWKFSAGEHCSESSVSSLVILVAITCSFFVCFSQSEMAVAVPSMSVADLLLEPTFDYIPSLKRMPLKGLYAF